MICKLSVLIAFFFVDGIKQTGAVPLYIMTDGREGKTWGDQIDMSDIGLDLSERKSMIFQVQTCKRVGVKFLPKGRVIGELVPRVKFNKHSLGSKLVFANFQTCHLASIWGKLENCTLPGHGYTGSACDALRPFWFRISEDGVLEVGEGCELGSRVFFKTDPGPFVLGDLELISEESAEWIIDDDSCSPFPDYVHREPAYERTRLKTYDGEIKTPLFAYGINILGRQTLVFSVMACGTARLDIYAKDSLASDPYYAIVYNTRNQTMKTYYSRDGCTSKTALDFVECEGTLSIVDDFCESLQTFWIRLQENEEYLVEFGKGCQVGTNTLGVHRRSSPFVIGDVKVQSFVEAEWEFGSEECRDEHVTSAGSDESYTERTRGSTNTTDGPTIKFDKTSDYKDIIDISLLYSSATNVVFSEKALLLTVAANLNKVLM